MDFVVVHVGNWWYLLKLNLLNLICWVDSTCIIFISWTRCNTDGWDSMGMLTSAYPSLGGMGSSVIEPPMAWDSFLVAGVLTCQTWPPWLVPGVLFWSVSCFVIGNLSYWRCEFEWAHMHSINNIIGVRSIIEVVTHA